MAGKDGAEVPLRSRSTTASTTRFSASGLSTATSLVMRSRLAVKSLPAWTVTGRRTESGRALPHLLQVRPRAFLLRSVPVLGKRRLGEQGALGGSFSRTLLQNCHARTPNAPRTNRFKQSDVPLLIDDSFDRLDHAVHPESPEYVRRS